MGWPRWPVLQTVTIGSGQGQAYAVDGGSDSGGNGPLGEALALQSPDLLAAGFGEATQQDADHQQGCQHKKQDGKDGGHLIGVIWRGSLLPPDVITISRVGWLRVGSGRNCYCLSQYGIAQGWRGVELVVGCGCHTFIPWRLSLSALSMPSSHQTIPGRLPGGRGHLGATHSLRWRWGIT